MSSAENVCDVHLVKTIPRKAGRAFLQRLTGWAREFGRSTVGHLSTSLLKCKCTHPCSGGYCHWTVLQSPSLSIFKKISSLLFHGYYWNISCSGLGWIVEAFFFLLVVLLGNPILILTLSHLPRLSMAWDKTGTREEILQVSLSLFFFQNCDTRQKSGRWNEKGYHWIRREFRDCGGRRLENVHGWKGIFNRAQNVPLKKQQTLLTLHNSAKQNNSHL